MLALDLRPWVCARGGLSFDNRETMASNQSLYAVDNLPHLTRQAVIEGLINATPFKILMEVSGLTRVTLARYRDEVLLPALRNPTSRQNKDIDPTNAIQAARLIPAQTVVQRLSDDMVARSTRLMDRLEKAENLDARGWSAVANVGVKAITLLGQLSGELGNNDRDPGITVQIVVPMQGPAALRPAIQPPTIDIGLQKD